MEMSPELWALVATGISVGSSMLSAALPDKSKWYMKLINLLAVNIGKATNNPDKNS